MATVARRTRASRDVERTEESVLQVTASGIGIAEDKRKVIEVRKFETDPAYVRVSSGVTKNLGNYESLRVDVSLSVPCYTEEMASVQKRVAGLVADMLDEEVEQYLGKGD